MLQKDLSRVLGVSDAIIPLIRMNKKIANYQAFVFDLDNTLISTSAIFKTVYSQFRSDLLALKKSKKYAKLLDWQAFTDEFFRRDREYYMSGRVNLNYRGQEILGNLLKNYISPEEKVYNEILEQLVEYNRVLPTVYEKIPDAFPGAVDLLKTIQEAKRDFIICTHSGDEWAARKIAPLEKATNSKIPFFAVSLDEKKDEASLLSALERLNLRRQKHKQTSFSPEEVLMVGDNLDADIRSAKKAGFGGGIFLNLDEEQYGGNWQEEFSELNQDWPLIQAKSLFEIIDLLKAA